MADDPREMEVMEIAGYISESALHDLDGPFDSAIEKLRKMVDDNFHEYENLFLEFDSYMPGCIVWGMKKQENKK